jgi:hypothetical protein
MIRLRMLGRQGDRKGNLEEGNQVKAEARNSATGYHDTGEEIGWTTKGSSVQQIVTERQEIVT